MNGLTEILYIFSEVRHASSFDTFCTKRDFFLTIILSTNHSYATAKLDAPVLLVDMLLDNDLRRDAPKMSLWNMFLILIVKHVSMSVIQN